MVSGFVLIIWILSVMEYRIPKRFEILNYGENVHKRWDDYVKHFGRYLIASDNQERNEAAKIAILLNIAGEEIEHIYDTLHLDQKCKTFTEVTQELSSYFKPTKNIIFERYVFLTHEVKGEQSIEDFVLELRKLSESCEYVEQENMIRDKLVMSVKDDELRKLFLQEQGLTLTSALAITKRFMAMKNSNEVMSSKLNTSVMKFENKAEVDYVQRSKSAFKMRGENKNSECNFCGYCHNRNDPCPARGKVCNYCKKNNHFENKCFMKQRTTDKNFRSTDKNFRSVQTIHHEDVEERLIPEFKNINMETLSVIDTVNTPQTDRLTEWLETIDFEGVKIACKLDTGAQCNAMPMKIVCQILNKNEYDVKYFLEPTDMRLVAYNNTTINPSGIIYLKGNINNKDYLFKFVVVTLNTRPILGLNACCSLGLIKRIMTVDVKFKSVDDIISQYGKVFKGIGKFPGEPYKIKLKPNATPVNNPPRRVARTILPRLKAALEKLEEDQIIQKVTEPNEWCHNIVVREKPSKELRICLDPRDLNVSVIKDSHYIPSQEDILSNMNNCTLFSVLDLTSAFHQIPLDHESANLCCFSTPFGRYKYLRCPFGISTMSEVCQRKNQELFGDIDGVYIYIDDLYIAAEDEISHDKILKEVLDRALSAGVTLNSKKIQFKKHEVKILGFIVNKDGIQIDKERTEAIANLKRPETKKEIMQFLGMVQYFSKFIPNISEITFPLRELIKKDAKWLWLDNHENAFKTLKKCLMTSPVLAHFDENKEILIQTDASSYALGSCLIQDGRVVAYASRSMTDTEQKYAQVEKELLSILFACQKFHYYIYGKRTTVQTDHKPLITIVNKEIHKVSPRMQRMLLKLFRYELHVEYLPGPKMLIADILSRNVENIGCQENDSDLDLCVHDIKLHHTVNDEKLRMVKEESGKDAEMMKIMKCVTVSEWPNMKYESEEMKTFFKIREELSELDGILFKNNKIVIPKGMRQHVLEAIHETHLGMNKMKMKARELVYWPNMNIDIEKYVRRCDVCDKFSNDNPKLPMISHEIPDRPWEKLAVDLMEHKDNDYLVVYDYFSKWIEVLKLRAKNSGELIKKLIFIFSYHGAPDIIVSDNMPFLSVEMKSFFQEWNIKSITSSPRYPRGNAVAERAVGIAKQMLNKNENNLDLALLQYRNSPIVSLGLTPAQLLMSRVLKEKLPIQSNQLYPKMNDTEKIKENLKQAQDNNKKYYDRNTREQSNLRQHQKVSFKINPEKPWEKGLVKNIYTETPRSYEIEHEETGKVYRRNRQHLRPTYNNEGQQQVSHDVSMPEIEDNQQNQIPARNLRDRSRLRAPDRYSP